MKRLLFGITLFGLVLLRVAPANAGLREEVDITGRFDANTEGELAGPNLDFEMRWTLPVPVAGDPNFGVADPGSWFQGSPGFSYRLDGAPFRCTTLGSEWFSADEGGGLLTSLFWTDPHNADVKQQAEFDFRSPVGPGVALYSGPTSDPRLLPGVYPFDPGASVNVIVESPDLTMERGTSFTGGQIAIGVPVVPERSPLGLVAVSAGVFAVVRGFAWAKSQTRCAEAGSPPC